jgi:hypothetical protein
MGVAIRSYEWLGNGKVGFREVCCSMSRGDVGVDWIQSEWDQTSKNRPRLYFRHHAWNKTRYPNHYPRQLVLKQAKSLWRQNHKNLRLKEEISHRNLEGARNATC